MSPTIHQTWQPRRDQPTRPVKPPRRPRLAGGLVYSIIAGLVGLVKLIGRATDRLLSVLPAFSLRRLFSFLLTASFFGGLFLLLTVIWYSRDLPNPNRLIDRPVEQSTKILDRTGKNILYEIFNEQKRSLITLADIPQHLIDSTIAAEDKDFFEHRGFDLSGIARAFYKDLKQGRITQGGSTITQQLIKNAVLTKEKSFSRKIREAILAWQMERKFTKDQILQLYLNEIPYGSTVYGIEAAAQTFFGKPAKDISLAEGALLAALPKAPTYYSPFGTHREQLLARQGSILQAMAELNMITQEDADHAKEEPVLDRLAKQRTNITAPHFVFFVRELLAEQYGEQTIDRGGLEVITTLDLNKQKIAEEVISERAESNLKNFKASNAALVSIDVATGDVLAMVGSKDYFDDSIDGQVNVTLQPRQPGSSFKPVVYGLAFERGFTPETKLYDVITTFKNYPKDYEPHNYDDKERGPISLRSALAGSLNIPAVKLLSLLGVERVLERAEQLGYTTFSDRSRFGLSLVLGGGEVKLLEHANAYAALARDGLYQPYRAILQIKDSNGKVLFDQTALPEQTRVFDEQAVRTLTNVLSDSAARAYIFGANNALILPDRAVAAKTGTTNDARDAWTIGYTPSLVTGVWVGNNNNDAMTKSASTIAAPIWQTFMKRVLASTPAETFKSPEPKITKNPYLSGLAPGEEIVRLNRLNGKRATAATPPELITEVIYRTGHSILHVINPENPDGPLPTDPSKNPQYENWEKAVRAWYEKQGLTLETPPQEYDDNSSGASIPVTIIKPQNNSLINEPTVPLDLQFSTDSSSVLSIYLNDLLLETKPATATSSIVLPPNAENGFYSLRIVIQDVKGNMGQNTVSVNVVLPARSKEITWLSPQFGAVLNRTSVPIIFSLSTPSLPPDSTAAFMLRSTANNFSRQMAYQTSIEGEKIKLEWNGPIDPGTYALSVRVARPGQTDLISEEQYFVVR